MGWRDYSHYSLFMGALIHPIIYLVFIAAAILGFAAGCEYYHGYVCVQAVISIHCMFY